MKAAVYAGNQSFDVKDIPTPEPGPDQVLLKVKYSAICGTDVHTFLYDQAPSGIVMGHEYCGTIAHVGADVTRWKVGDRVLGGGGAPPPGAGPAFVTDPRYKYREVGFTGRPLRGYAEYVVMEEWEPVLIPDGVSDEAASLCEPCAVAVRAVRHSKVKLGDKVAVLGAGPIGLFCIQAVKAAGAGAVYVSEPVPVRAEAARNVGADLVIDPTGEDVVARLEELTDGLGPDVVFDCAGATPTLDQAMNIVRRDGQVMLVAVAWTEVPLLPVDWMAREVSIQSTWGGRHEDWKIALELLRTGKIIVGPMLTSSSFIPLDDIQDAFESLIKPTTQLQMVVVP
jgi:2-desacetyl-2-hydroxyethyl bacteriochlorophyllide A dehydrogenase